MPGPPSAAARVLAIVARTVTLGAVIVTVVTIARLLVVSNYQVPTATAVAGSLGAVSTLTGTLLPVFGAFLPIVALALAAGTFIAPFFLSLEATARIMLAAAIAGIATLLVSPTTLTLDEEIRRLQEKGGAITSLLSWQDYTPVGLFILGIFAAGFLRGYSYPNFSWQRYLFLTTTGIIVVTTFSLVAIDAYPIAPRLVSLPDTLGRMWLPSEIVVTKNGTPRVGYVLSVAEGWTNILWEGDRTVSIIKSDDVTSRTICRLGEPDSLPFFSRSDRPPVVPRCSL